jgi:hypothetical protein
MLSATSQQGKERLTRLVPEYDAGKTKYPVQKEAKLIKQKYITQETAAQIALIDLNQALKTRRAEEEDIA